MATDIVLNELILQEVTQAEYERLVKDNLLDENRVYFTPDNSLKGSLLDFKWADHLLNDISWLRADTFSWQSGDVYVAAYNHLVADFEGATAETETIDGIEITYYRAEDKHKICLPDQEDKLLELYNKTGVAWYYILDTENKQFKLPRTKFGVTGLRDEVGNYVPESVPSFSASFITTNTGGGGLGTEGAISGEGYNNGAYSGGGGRPNSAATLTVDPSITTAAYQSNAAVQERATQVYLYFYVGNFERDAVEQTAGITVETLNGKADSDLGNIPANYDYVVESQEPTAENGYTWYRKYKSGWVEQGSRNSGLNSVGVNTMPIEMADISYSVQITRLFPTTANDPVAISIQARNLTTTTFEGRQTYSNVGLGSGDSYAYCWQVSGVSAQ